MNFVSGSFNTETVKMVCVSSHKYGEVELCIKSNMSIPVAKLKLYDTDRAVDADATFEDAKNFGNEIARRWNAGSSDSVDGSYPDSDLVSIIANACLKHRDSGEASCSKEARVIIAELEKAGYSIVISE
ncbi:MAG: hypothetical protein AABY22_35335 [Nanoarchaeota archaeon]